MNKLQAFRMVCNGYPVFLKMKYHERCTGFCYFSPYEYGNEKRKEHFNHVVECEKDAFRKISTYYGGNKKDCKFWFEVVANKAESGGYYVDNSG